MILYSLQNKLTTRSCLDLDNTGKAGRANGIYGPGCIDEECKARDKVTCRGYMTGEWQTQT